ncbi:MAG TPA: class II aldolase/adducin family protein [Acidiferrobacter sp.]|nr:class II aldolase/adducin family protein [Acidiferrobacter sp.]
MGILDNGDTRPPNGPAHQEGVTKFDLRYEWAPALPPARVQTLNAWRRILFDLGLIGEEITTTGPVGFGNVSQRLEHRCATELHFLITATQTGHKHMLTPDDYSLVTSWDLDANRVSAQGPAAPSSESLTHAVIYAALPQARFVFHVHSSVIWSQAHQLGLPSTARDTPYGTPEIAHEVQALLARPDPLHPGILVMGGHTNGIIAFGETADATGQVLVQALAEARAGTNTPR